MRRAALLAALGLAAGAAAFLALRDGPRAPSTSSPQRPAPLLPAPTVGEKVAWLYGLFRSGTTLTAKPLVAGAAPFDLPVWNEIGGTALLRLGEPALDFLVSPERRSEYLAAPNLLVSVLDLLARAPPSQKTFPFLAHWLDEENCPGAVPGSNWPEEIRLHVYGALKARPVVEAVPTCLAELDRPQGVHDLRGAAIDILLRLGEADVLNEYWSRLPPTPERPEPDMRSELIERLFQMAAPAAGERSRGQVEALEPLLRQALEGRPVERVGAMGALHRLGRPGMAEGLLAFFEEHRGGSEAIAWSALKLLATDRAEPAVKALCLAEARSPGPDVGFATAVRLLALWWPEEIASRFLEWAEAGTIDAYLVLPAMLRADRERVVGWLRKELRTTDMAALLRALGFVAGERITELVPDLFELARSVAESNRPPVYRALVALRAPGVEPLLLAELKAGIPDHLRSAAAASLLDVGGDAGISRLAELLAEGDAAVLDALLQRARVLGPAGVAPALVRATLRALRTMPSEEGRRAALLVLRFRGRLDDVRDGLAEAYRFEPSRRVAKEIGAVLDELAHR